MSCGAILKISASVALLATAGCLCSLLLTMRRTAAELPRIAAETRDQVLSTVNVRLDKISGQTDRQLNALRVQVLRETSAQITATRDQLFESVNGRVGDTLQRVDRALADVESLQKGLAPTIANAAAISTHVNSIASHVDDALPQFTDCAYLDEAGEPIGGNPDCVFNRFQGTSKAIERMAIAGAAAAPQVATSVQHIADSADGIAADAKKEADLILAPKTFKQQLLDYLKLAALTAHYLF